MHEPAVVNEDDVEPESWSDPVRGVVSFRTLFGGAEQTGDFTAGVTELEVGGWLEHHRHAPPEIYYIVSGEGTVCLDGHEHEVRGGTSVYIPGNSEHSIRNSGKERLRFFYAFAVDSFDDIEYRFTDDT
jgi:mannose-6-phosphate isomerase-like protein (cupin superfamily)